MNQSVNEVVENTTVDDGTIESVPKNMSLGGSKHGHVDSLALSTKLINGFYILKCFQEFISIGQATSFGMKWEYGHRVLQDYLLEIESRLEKGEAIEGDENSKFFYDIVNKKRRQQAIKGILVDSKWIDNPGRLKREFYNHFANKFSALDWSRVSMEGIFPRHIGTDFSCNLEGDISNDEIKRAEQALLVKSDFQKAFYSVKWNHLDDILGFKVNMYKSSLYGLGVHSLDVQSMANKFGHLANNLPFTYLGVKVAANMTRTSSWNGVDQKVTIMLSKWKVNPYQ
nr:RNA-directed DNA polymerase, eukaryota [Tanacetum cinerariifolium]